MISDQWAFWLCVALALAFAFLFIITPFIVKNKKIGKRSLIIVFSLTLGVMFSSVTLYKYYGALDGLKDKAMITQIAQTLSQLQGAQSISREIVLEHLTKLEKKLPNRSAPWSYLAGVYQHLGFLEQAAFAYHQASILSPEVLAYVTQEAYLISRMHEGVLSSFAKKQLEMFLKKEPHNQDILNLLAINAYQKKQYPTALKYWEHLLNQAENLSSEDKQTIVLMMRSAGAHIAENA